MSARERSEQESQNGGIPVRSGRKRRRGLRLAVGGAVAAGCGVAVLIGVALGLMIAGRPTVSPSETVAAGDAAATTWTCSMHPQIKLPKPGKCPICFMELIPLSDESAGEGGPRELKMSEAAVALANIQTTPVRRQYATKTVRLVGKVDYDETRLADITAWVPGRLDRLYVDYTGIAVRKGDHLILMYSPDLLIAQRELLQTSKTHHELPAGPSRQLAARTLESTEEKLRLLGLLDEQIEQIKRRGTPSDRLTIYAPAGGIVIQKHAKEGMYVQTGTKIYTIADLSRVWVYLDAYESDVPWLRYGQEVEFATESHPGEVFRGRVVFIDPVLNETTRTVRVRVNVPNEDLRLKPGMLVRAIVSSRLAEGADVLEPALAGKWISPMHPEIVKDGPGKCDVCGMDLVPAEDLGFVGPAEEAAPPLIIPAPAPLITGKRAVVYVKLPDREEPTFEGREVTLGPRVGDGYIVRDGLREGEEVVTNGNFKIDSALQIQARPSMMSPGAESEAGRHTHGERPPETLRVSSPFRAELVPLYEAYLSLQEALADDRQSDAKAAWRALRGAVGGPRTDRMDERAGEAWRATSRKLAENLAIDLERSGVDDLRKPFEAVAATMLEMVDAFGHAMQQPLYEAFCPMAFKNKGARWLQAGEEIANPYFGHKMLWCGEIRREFPSGSERTTQEGRP